MSVQPGVVTVLPHQLRVAALLNNPPPLHHQNPVRVADGAQPMGDDQTGKATGQAYVIISSGQQQPSNSALNSERRNPMVQITMQIPDQLAEQVLPVRRWLPIVLELGLARFKTPTAQTSAEVIDFLLGNPTPVDVLNYRASERSQERLRRLFALNRSGLLGEAEQAELDEMERLEHIIIMLKAQVVNQTEQAV